MGLATIDPHSLKEHTQMYGCVACRTAVRQAIHFFVNFNIFKWLYLAYYWVYLHQTWGFCKYRGVLFQTMWINSCYSHNLQTRT